MRRILLLARRIRRYLERAFLLFLSSAAPFCITSNDFVIFDDERRDLSDELFGVGHEGLAARRPEPGFQIVGVAKPELHDAVDGKLVVGEWPTASVAAVEDQILRIPLYFRQSFHEFGMDVEPLPLEFFR